MTHASHTHTHTQETLSSWPAYRERVCLAQQALCTALLGHRLRCSSSPAPVRPARTPAQLPVPSTPIHPRAALAAPALPAAGGAPQQRCVCAAARHSAACRGAARTAAAARHCSGYRQRRLACRSSRGRRRFSAPAARPPRSARRPGQPATASGGAAGRPDACACAGSRQSAAAGIQRGRAAWRLACFGPTLMHTLQGSVQASHLRRSSGRAHMCTQAGSKQHTWQRRLKQRVGRSCALAGCSGTGMHAQARTHIHTHNHTYACAHACVCTHSRTHTYTHACTPAAATVRMCSVSVGSPGPVAAGAEAAAAVWQTRLQSAPGEGGQRRGRRSLQALLPCLHL